MSRIRCFWLEPTELAEASLRRFRYSLRYLKDEDGLTDYSKEDPNYYKCTTGRGCDASVILGQVPYTEDFGRPASEVEKVDARWPAKCETCGREFVAEDAWQRREAQLYKRSDNGELVILRAAPPGAMWNAPWMKDFKSIKQRPDGITLVLMTPDGEWCVDGPSSNGDGWERSGTIPDVTANPSIICGKYHGWLRNGWLEEC